MKSKARLQLLTILLLLTFSFNAQAQENETLSKKDAKQLLEIAEQEFEENKFLDALDKFTQLYNYKPNNIALSLKNRIKNSEIDIVEQANHIIVLNNPVDLNKSIERFLFE